MLLRRPSLLRPMAAVLVIALAAVACSSDDNEDALCGGTEFVGREDGMLGLQDTYGFEFPEVKTIDDNLVYSQVAGGDCLFGSIFRTDGRISELDLVVLEDDQEFFPPFNAAVVMREEVYDPALDDLFDPIAEALDEDTMIGLNSQVVTDGEDDEQVAREWLEDNGFLGSGETPLAGQSFTVGSKEFTEQLILGYLTVAVLEDAGAEVNSEVGLIGSDIVRGALESGDIDIYWEYLGTAWVTYLGNDEAVSSDPQEQLEALQEEDEGFAWLDVPTPFNDTYGIAMTREKSEELGITTISDIKTWLEEN